MNQWERDIIVCTQIFLLFFKLYSKCIYELACPKILSTDPLRLKLAITQKDFREVFRR